jgi:hypothetical protein
MPDKPRGGRAWRQTKYNKSRKVQWGREKLQQQQTTAPPTTLDRNNKKNQHENLRISLDSSKRTSIDRRFAPPLNNILAGYSVTIVSCTTPRSYAALLPPSI